MFSAEKLSARGNDQAAVVLGDENSDNSGTSDGQNEPNSDPDGTENPPSQMSPMQPSVDPQIRHLWSEAIDLSEVRNGDDQAEFRSLLIQLGIDVSLQTCFCI
jgi:hypothetical protein